MDILAKLLGSAPRAKLMRLFLFNPELSLSLQEIMRRSRINSTQARKELSLLEGVGVVKVKRVKGSSGRKSWSLNEDFLLADNLRALFNAEFLASRDELIKRFRGCGKLKLVLLSGLFVQDGGGRADIVIIGDELKRRAIEKIMVQFEAELGREITYAILETKDFIYRMHSSDKFIRDILDYPHQRLLDKIVAA